MKIHQFHYSASAADAVTNHMLLIQESLREIGISGDIFCQKAKGLTPEWIRRFTPTSLRNCDLILIGGVSGLSFPRALQGAVDMAALGSAEREGGDGLNTIAGKVRIERLAIERVAGDNEGNVAIDGAGTGRCGPSNSTLQVLPCESRQRTVQIAGLVHETCERRYRGTR